MRVDELTRGALEVIERADLEQKLERGRPLVVKLGADPTAPDLHLGHSVVLTMMRRFKDSGHRAQFLIGDFTGAIGDPSGRNTMRPQLAREQIDAAAATYAAQVSKIVEAEIVFNSTWMAQLPVAEFIELASRYTVARMLERDDFAKRLAETRPLAIHELLYPLVQGYDSVAMRADVELGGSDQRLNLLVGRDLQRAYGQEPQVLVLMPLLLGIDGVEKMSKSKGNAIGITESPAIQIEKTMGITDETMWQWYPLLSSREPDRSDPRAAKLALAREIATRFHGHAAANDAIDDYERRARGAMPDSMPEFRLGTCLLVQAIVATGLADTASRARGAIQQKTVAVDGVVVTDETMPMTPGVHVLRLGKRRFVRVIVS
jgi:tyrosyl-tRNA synthetase